MKQFLLIVLLMVAIEMLCVFYLSNFEKRLIVRTSLLGAVNAGINKYVIIETVSNNYLIIAVLLGSYLGTYIAMKYFNKPKQE